MILFPLGCGCCSLANVSLPFSLHCCLHPAFLSLAYLHFAVCLPTECLEQASLYIVKIMFRKKCVGRKLVKTKVTRVQYGDTILYFYMHSAFITQYERANHARCVNGSFSFYFSLPKI